MSRRCTYTYRQDHIHEFTFHDSSRDVVDEWIGSLNMIEAYGEGKPLLLVDISKSGIPPLGYFLTRLRQWQFQHPTARIGRCAVVYEGNLMLLSLLRSTVLVLDTSIRKRTKFFNSYAYDQAIDWLNQIRSDQVSTT